MSSSLRLARVCGVCSQLIGIDTLRTKDVRHTHELIWNHIARIRASPGLDKCTVVLSLESNLAFESQHILHYLTSKGLERWVALSEGQGGSLGFLTTHETKEMMCFQLRDALKIGNIALYNEFFSTQMDTTEALRQIKDELSRFSIVTEPAKTLFGKARGTRTFYNPVS